MGNSFQYGIDKLTTRKVTDVASGKLKAVTSPEALNRINASSRYVKEIVDTNRTVYGVNTGFGILANTAISPGDTATLQYKILQSHSVGIGDPVPDDIAKL